jgi:hypothetical protein
MVLVQKDEYSPNTWLSSPNLRTKFKRQKNINAQIWILQNLEKNKCSNLQKQGSKWPTKV